MIYLSVLVLHFIGLALGVGTSMAMLTLGALARNLPDAERGAFMQRVSPLRKHGSYGLALLILSGLSLFILRGPAQVMAWGGPAFHAKLTLVVVLCGLFGYLQVVAKKAREAGGSGPLVGRLFKLSVAMLVVSVAIVICAVIAFQ